MTLRGNGENFGAVVGTYYNPRVVYPRVAAVSAISPDIGADVTPTATVPGTPQAGYLVFCQAIAAGPAADVTFTPPAGEGFLSIASGWDQTGSDTRTELFWKRWGAGDIDNMSVVFSSSLPNARIALVTVADASLVTAPTALAMAGSTNVSSPTLVAPSVVVPQRGLLMHFYEAAASGGVYVDPDVSTVYGGIAYLGTAGADVSLACDAEETMSGSSPTFEAQASALSVSNGWNTVTVGLAGDSAAPVVAAFSAISADVNSPNATNTVPGAPAAGDIVLAHLGNSSAAVPGLAPPAGEGWALLENSHSTTNMDSTIAVYWKRWGEMGQTDNMVVNFTGSSGNTRLVLALVTGCVTSGNPFAADGVSTQSDSSGDSMSITAPSLVVPYDQALVMRFFAASNIPVPISINPPMNLIYGGTGYRFTNGNNGAIASSAQIRARAGTASQRTASTSIATGSGNVGITAIVPPV